jgi:16S rRNA (cytidine1402-2'-O)-methyltransferase
VDVAVFEEDRPARQALKAAGVHRPYLKHNEHRDDGTLAEIESALRAGKTVSYMSDQGTSGVADPGSKLAAMAFRLKCPIKVVPGPSSITCALSVFPLHIEEYYYVGFLPRESLDRTKKLQNLARLKVPLVILDTPYRLKAVLADCLKVFGTDQKALMAVEIGNDEQSYHWDKIKSLAELDLDKNKNFVLVIAAI